MSPEERAIRDRIAALLKQVDDFEKMHPYTSAGSRRGQQIMKVLYEIDRLEVELTKVASA